MMTSSTTSSTTCTCTSTTTTGSNNNDNNNNNNNTTIRDNHHDHHHDHHHHCEDEPTLSLNHPSDNNNNNNNNNNDDDDDDDDAYYALVPIRFNNENNENENNENENNEASTGSRICNCDAIGTASNHHDTVDGHQYPFVVVAHRSSSNNRTTHPNTTIVGKYDLLNAIHTACSNAVGCNNSSSGDPCCCRRRRRRIRNIRSNNNGCSTNDDPHHHDDDDNDNDDDDDEEDDITWYCCRACQIIRQWVIPSIPRQLLQFVIVVVVPPPPLLPVAGAQPNNKNNNNDDESNHNHNNKNHNSEQLLVYVRETSYAMKQYLHLVHRQSSSSPQSSSSSQSSPPLPKQPIDDDTTKERTTITTTTILTATENSSDTTKYPNHSVSTMTRIDNHQYQYPPPLPGWMGPWTVQMGDVFQFYAVPEHVVDDDATDTAAGIPTTTTSTTTTIPMKQSLSPPPVPPVRLQFQLCRRRRRRNRMMTTEPTHPRSLVVVENNYRNGNNNNKKKNDSVVVPKESEYCYPDANNDDDDDDDDDRTVVQLETQPSAWVHDDNHHRMEQPPSSPPMSILLLPSNNDHQSLTTATATTNTQHTNQENTVNDDSQHKQTLQQQSPPQQQHDRQLLQTTTTTTTTDRKPSSLLFVTPLSSTIADGNKTTNEDCCYHPTRINAAPPTIVVTVSPSRPQDHPSTADKQLSSSSSSSIAVSTSTVGTTLASIAVSPSTAILFNDSSSGGSCRHLPPPPPLPLPPPYIFYFVEKGTDMHRTIHIPNLQQNARRRGAMVLPSFYYNRNSDNCICTTRQLSTTAIETTMSIPTHFILSTRIYNFDTMVTSLGFSDIDEMTNFLQSHGIVCASRDWASELHDGPYEKPTLLQLVPGFSNNSSSSTLRKRKLLQHAAEKMVSQDDIKEQNRPLSDVFRRLAKLHQDCPLYVNDDWKSYMFQLVSGRILHVNFIISSNEIHRLRNMNGFGASTIQIIEEFLRTGTCQRIVEFENDPQRKAMNIMMNIWGVGRVRATELVTAGCKRLGDVKQAINNGTLHLDRNQYIGLICYDDINERMSRKEVEAIAKIITSFVHARYTTSAETIIMGSYRRGKETCGDVDVLVTHPDYVDTVPSHALGEIVDDLCAAGHVAFHLTYISGMKPELYETLPAHVAKQLTNPKSYGRSKEKKDKNSMSSWMGVMNSPLIPGKCRRVDIKFYPYAERSFASLYFTGNGHFNRSMRLYATRKYNYTLSDHGLIDKNTELPIIRHPPCERDIFDVLGLQWKETNERECFDDVEPYTAVEQVENDDISESAAIGNQQRELTREEVLRDNTEHAWID